MMLFKKFNHVLNYKQKRSVLLLLFLIFIGMFLETLGVGIVIPVFTIIMDPNIVDKYPAGALFLTKLSPLNWLPNNLNISSIQNQIITGAIMIIIFVYIFKACFLIFLTWVQSTFITNLNISWSDKLFSGYLFQPYSFHLQRNSALLIRNINQTGNFAASLELTLVLISEILVVVGISSLLIITEPLGASVIILIFLLSSYIFHLYTKKHLHNWGIKRHLHEGQRIKHIQQGLGGVKDLKILGREKTFSFQFLKHAMAVAWVSRNQKVLKSLPRLWLEIIIVICLSVLLLLMLIEEKSVNELIPTLGLFAAASFRLMPSANKILGNIQQLKYDAPVINNIYKELVENKPKEVSERFNKILSFKKSIKLENISYTYEKTSIPTINNININIDFGSQVGFIGESGAGKSTLINIILGLLNPKEGVIKIDDFDIQSNLRGWQNQIGYVPQDIFLTDDTLRNNIAFAISEDKILDETVKKAIKEANLEKFVKGLPNGLNTMVGERGVRISGGQRQRIGIARALYHQPSVLILDEATSSLDTDTEKEIMKGVIKLKNHKTVLIVSHRPSTVEMCDQIFKIESGKIVKKGKFEEVI